MEDDKLKDLFRSFDPGVSDDTRFMERLEKNIDSVEMIRQHNAAVQRRNRRAVAAAALTGFAVGFVFALAMPWLLDAISNMALSIPEAGLSRIVSNNTNQIAWAIAALTSALISMNAYDLSLSLQKARERQRG